MKVAALEQLQPAQVDPRLVLGAMAVMPEVAPQGMLAEVAPAGYLSVPDYLGGRREPLVVPALRVVTHRDRQGSHPGLLVDVHGSEPVVNGLFEAAVRGVPEERLAGMVFGQTTRMLTNAGANGLHHIRGTRMPGTVYYPVNRGPHVYMTQIGTVPGGESEPPVPVLAIVGATAKGDAAAERKFLSVLKNTR